MTHRVIYIHDAYLPQLIKRAKGVVTINSTVGLSALHHGTSIKTLGYAIYDIPGLTFQGDLAEFWNQPGVVDADLYQRFRAWLMRNNQVKGNFYRRFSKQVTPTGLSWPTSIKKQLFQPKLETENQPVAAAVNSPKKPLLEVS